MNGSDEEVFVSMHVWPFHKQAPYFEKVYNCAVLNCYSLVASFVEHTACPCRKSKHQGDVFITYIQYIYANAYIECKLSFLGLPFSNN